MVAIPRKHTLDSSLALLKESYSFIGNRCQRSGFDISRPLHLCVNHASLERPEVQAFLHVTFDHIDDIVRTVQYVRLPEADYAADRGALEALAP